MKINATGLLLCSFLVGCGGTAPFGDTGTTTDDTIESTRDLPPGTTSPKPSSSIFRKEAETETGNGFAQGVRYNAADDTFAVDNLPFDGGADTPYQRGAAVGSFGEYAVYEAVAQYPDTQNGQVINQFRHRAIYGVSRTGQTEFAIVRTGAYVDYGFGGFVYERNGRVVLPTTGQAVFTGKGAGLRDFQGGGGLEYTTSDVEIAVDFDDFNDSTGRYEGAVDGTLRNRRIFDLSGQDITNDVLARINTAQDSSLTAIPSAVFSISVNALDPNGEITGEVTSRLVKNNGQAVAFETGKYYGVISGDNADELVGIVVMESSLDPAHAMARDTTGFTIYRQP